MNTIVEQLKEYCTNRLSNLPDIHISMHDGVFITKASSPNYSEHLMIKELMDTATVQLLAQIFGATYNKDLERHLQQAESAISLHDPNLLNALDAFLDNVIKNYPSPDSLIQL